MTSDRETSPPALLRAVTKCVVDGGDFKPGDTFWAEASVAVELLMDGHAELVPEQVSPPTAIVHAIAERAAEPEDVGVVWRDPKSVEHFEKNVLASATRRSTFAGKTFNWIEGLQALRAYADRALRVDRKQLESVYNQLLCCRDARIARCHGQLISHSSPLSAAAALARGLLLEARPPRAIGTRRISGSSVEKDGNYAYYQVGPE